MTPNSAFDARRRNLEDLVSFDRLFIANPDLVEASSDGPAPNVPQHYLAERWHIRG
jgi:2,4-dienoyl-CoA reductase-like NADH-dependent reductase (Old Yellow Enzyme family)